ncbi:phosphonate ABC transporter, permease protein PhnE [Nodosilinea sp. LEGE 07088]|uniref:phosphonate ABC transporter, permease protein PhnE n=1 Tax=Nodosilinea sp. LEGE 07088 TaxID=2777968 RepID=UPI00187FCD40|nr:phosphonate ABC transporter, permease protein PhnE [Nodosilinea sp. LEGE 07088]
MLAQERPLITVKRVVYGMIAIAILMGAAYQSEISLGELIQGSGRMAKSISRYFPPDFSNAGFPKLGTDLCPRQALLLPLGFNTLCIPLEGYIPEIIETIGMAIWGTLLSAILAVPLSVVAAENVAPYWLVFIVRRFLDAMRAINEIVFALIFVVAVGLGPFAGVLALFVHTTGILGKLFSEAIESIEPGPVEGIRSTGASKVQEVAFGIIPQVMPLWTSFTLYRFESNVRSASVLGFVGAGGIGFSLFQSIKGFREPQVCAILILLVASVGIIDTLSSKLRQRLV